MATLVLTKPHYITNGDSTESVPARILRHFRPHLTRSLSKAKYVLGATKCVLRTGFAGSNSL